jgi:hypothetical protein
MRMIGRDRLLWFDVLSLISKFLIFMEGGGTNFLSFSPSLANSLLDLWDVHVNSRESHKFYGEFSKKKKKGESIEKEKNHL